MKSRLLMALFPLLAAGCIDGEVLVDDPPARVDGGTLPRDGGGGGTGDGGGGNQDAAAAVITFTANILPMFTTAPLNCTVCHSTAAKMGNYSVQTYAEAIGNGADGTPNVIPGNAANSKLNTELRPNHQGLTLTPAQLKLIEDWINAPNNARQN